MNEAILKMLEKYECRSLEDYVRALREILQEIALLGLWRSKFFDKAAFYGGTALRILYGLDRFSEDLDFSLLLPTEGFDISGYAAAVEKEILSFGFDIHFEPHAKTAQSPAQSSFLKASTLKQLMVIEASNEVIQRVHRNQVIKIKLEVDTDPPPMFNTHTRYLLQPIPFAVRVYMLPDLLAGKMHALLCRRWKNRVKGRDWYDLVWYAAHHPELNLSHLEQRMRQSGDWLEDTSLTRESFNERIKQVISELNIDQARKEVEPFVKDPASLSVWSLEFFYDIAERIKPV